MREGVGDVKGELHKGAAVAGAFVGEDDAERPDGTERGARGEVLKIVQAALEADANDDETILATIKAAEVIRLQLEDALAAMDAMALGPRAGHARPRLLVLKLGDLLDNRLRPIVLKRRGKVFAPRGRLVELIRVARLIVDGDEGAEEADRLEGRTSLRIGGREEKERVSLLAIARRDEPEIVALIGIEGGVDEPVDAQVDVSESGFDLGDGGVAIWAMCWKASKITSAMSS